MTTARHSDDRPRADSGRGMAAGWRRLVRVLPFAVAALACIAANAVAADTRWIESDADGARRVHLYFFWSESCPHCREARPFVEAIPRQRPWVSVHALEVSGDRDNARRFVTMARELGHVAEAVPTFMVCGEMAVGWEDAPSSGGALLDRLDACRARGGPAAGPAAVAEAAAPLRLPVLGEIDARSLSLPLLTVILAGLDAFNPCAFFVLLFLLSLLAHQRRRARMAAIGAVFVSASGLMYFAFMAAWLNLFESLAAFAWITMVAGLVAMLAGAVNIKDFFAFGRGLSLSIPDSRKPGLYRRARAILVAENLPAMLAATLLLAVAANFYELLCTAGLPMVYTRVLTLSDPGPVSRYAYLALYNLIYVVPLAAIVAAFVATMGARKLSEREGRLLKLASGVMMLELGLLLAFAPAWLDSVAVSALLAAVAIAATAIAARLTRGT